MSLPEGWMKACECSESRLKDYIPIEAINPTLCLESSCPAAKVLQTLVPGGMTVQVFCQFSKCIHRYPEKKDMKHFK